MLNHKLLSLFEDFLKIPLYVQTVRKTKLIIHVLHLLFLNVKIYHIILYFKFLFP